MLGGFSDTAAVVQLVVATLLGAGGIYMGLRATLRRQIRSVITDELSNTIERQVRSIVSEEVRPMAEQVAWLRGRLGNGQKE